MEFMRLAFVGILGVLSAALVICCFRARSSKRAIAPAVTLLLNALIPPVIGNLIIIASTQQRLSTFGYYVYFLGMDFIMFAMMRFTREYCQIGDRYIVLRRVTYALLAADVLQYALNPFFGQAFATEKIIAYGAPYYRLVPYLGQTLHRILDYGILFVIIILFAIQTVRSPRINAERYSVILSVILLTTAWETAYIFSRTPIDRAMVGFGVFGLLIFYLALYYRPMRLLDSMLANIASELPEALFFFDSGGQCIWANRPGILLAGVENENFDPVPERLRGMFGDYGGEEITQHTVRSGETVRSYVLEEHHVTDERQRRVGSFLSVRDNTAEQETLQREIYRGTHDSLTGLYNRAGYELILSGLELKSSYLLLVDADSFKEVNDTHGHETGDKVLQKIAATVRHNFRAEDYVCRIGGDEFVVIMAHTEERKRRLITSRVDRINAQLADTSDGLPAISVSVGIAHGEGAANTEELFEHADEALYETKRRGKRGYTFYRAKKGETDG